MYQAKNKSEYKIGYKVQPMKTLDVDEENDTQEYSMPDETDSQKEDASDGRCENSPQKVSNSIKSIWNSYIKYMMRNDVKFYTAIQSYLWE